MTARVYGGKSAQERVAQRHEQFLDAGLEVFGRQGWSASSVTDVCRAARLSSRFFYEHFASREELFMAVTARIADQVQRTVRDVVADPSGTPAERARAVLIALAGHFAADPRTVRVALMESLATAQFRRQRRELLESVSELGARLMRALRDGSPDEPTPATLRVSAALLVGGLAELLVAQATEDADYRVDPLDLVDHLTTVFTTVARL